jgi:threonine aldolase
MKYKNKIMIEKNLDFRSDTTTWPSPEMREAAAKTPVGDMGYGEDPAVNELESLAAEMLGKENAIFVTSGTQGNAVSILSQTQRGDEMILESRSHIRNMERGHWAIIGGLIPKTVNGVEGWMRPEDIRPLIRGNRKQGPKTSLLCVENTHLASGGTAITPNQLEADWEIAKEYDMGVHMDGARLFNAAISLNVDVKEIVQYTDTVQFCLSKGLAAPVGSIVAGTEELIEKAKTYRRILGGNMRQAGIIAAPGVVALKTMINRLKDDHDNAKLLGDGLEKLGFKLHYPVKTNMVFFDPYSIEGWTPERWVESCSKFGFKTSGRGGHRIRLVTHYGIERDDIETLLEGIETLI